MLHAKNKYFVECEGHIEPFRRHECDGRTDIMTLR